MFLTADPSARAARRTAENGAGYVEATEADLLRRDQIDSGRTAAPLTMADGAIHLDTTPYTLDEVVQQVVDIVDRGSGCDLGAAWLAPGRPDEPAMTDALRIDGGELPSTAGVRAPRTRLLTAGRPLAQALHPRRGTTSRSTAPSGCRATGPLVMAANHVGWLDGPLLAICSPRPVHALTKQEMFARPLGRVPAAPPVRSRSTGSRSTCARSGSRSRRCATGRAVGVFPEGTRGAGDMTSPRAGAAYLALVTGAPVVPVSFLGTRMPGGSDGSIPPRGSRIAMTFGDPIRLASRPWPRTQQEVAASAEAVTAGILQTMRTAEEATGMTLPGPLGPKREKRA